MENSELDEDNYSQFDDGIYSINDSMFEDRFENANMPFFNNEILSEISDYDDQFEYEACISEKYYIGTYVYIHSENILLFNTRIHTKTFFEFTCQDLSMHAYYTSIFNPIDSPEINIIQVSILPDDTYCAICKTFWLKIIQRTWKNACKKRALFRRSILLNLQSIQLRGMPVYLQYPTVCGLLSHYNRK